MEKRINNLIDDAIAYIEIKISTLRKRNGKFLARQEKIMERKITKRFLNQMEWIISEIPRLSFMQEEQQNSVKIIERKIYRREIEEFLDEMPEQENIAENIADGSKKSFYRGAKTAYTLVGMEELGVSFDLVNTFAVQYIQRLEDLHLSNYRGSINRTTKKRIITLLTDAAVTGESYSSVSKKIRDLSKEGVFSRARAELISTHEIGNAYETGNSDMIGVFSRETGAIMQKKWITVGDSKVTPTHTTNQSDGWIPYEATFSGTGDKHPPASDNPRCRCTLGYRRVDLNNNPL